MSSDAGALAEEQRGWLRDGPDRRDAREAHGPPPRGAEFARALLATFLLTGGRSAEVLGLEVSDVSFDKRTVTFRPNSWRRLKTLTSARVIPLWNQLAEILQPFMFGRPPSRLLLPSFVTGREAMVTDWRKTLDRIAVRAGWEAGEIRSKAFRYSFTAARLQTLEGGAPVSPFTVSRELGHGSRAMVEEVYAHLGTIRHRSEVVEYRIEQHAVVLADRLAKFRFVTTSVTTDPEARGNSKPRSRETATGSDVTTSGRPDLNRGPPAPEAGALTGLRYAPWTCCHGGIPARTAREHRDAP